MWCICTACFVLLPLKPTARDLCLCATKSALQRLLKNRVHICQRHRQRRRRRQYPRQRLTRRSASPHFLPVSDDVESRRISVASQVDWRSPSQPSRGCLPHFGVHSHIEEAWESGQHGVHGRVSSTRSIGNFPQVDSQTRSPASLCSLLSTVSEWKRLSRRSPLATLSRPTTRDPLI